MNRKKKSWLIRLLEKILKKTRFKVTYEYIVQEENFYLDKRVRHVTRYIWARTLSEARAKPRGRKHQNYTVQNIKVQ